MVKLSLKDKKLIDKHKIKLQLSYLNEYIFCLESILKDISRYKYRFVKFSANKIESLVFKELTKLYTESKNLNNKLDKLCQPKRK